MEQAKQLELGTCSDTHGGLLPRWPGKCLAAILHAGDVHHAPSLIDDEGDPSLRQWVESAGSPVLAVRGNHDHRDPGRFFQAADDITGRLRQLAPGLWVAGVGLAPERYYDLPGESDMEPQCSDLLRQARRQVMPSDRLILLTHYPPKLPELPHGEVPAHWTYLCLAQLVEQLRPVAIVQGHVHDWFGRQWRRPDGTLIVSPGPMGGLLTVAGDSARDLRGMKHPSPTFRAIVTEVAGPRQDP